MNTLFLFQRKNNLRFIIVLVICAGFMQVSAQKAKGPLQLADEYYAAGEYYTAAELYEQFLNPPKKQVSSTGFPLNSKRNGVVTSKKLSRADILYKQAECYRLANQWNRAAESYKASIEKDSIKYEEAWYWYAVCERSLGNYAAAEEGLKRFSLVPVSSLKADAEKEKQTLKYIYQQLARPDSVLVSLQKINTPNSFENGAYAPAYAGGGKFLISSTVTDSTRVNGVNPHHSRLFFASLNNGSFEDLTPASIATADNQGGASINGNYLYFSQWKKVNGRTVSSIYYSTKQGGTWSQPVLLTSVNTDGFNSKQPFCTSDGKYLYFSSDRPGGSGKFDIWYAPLNSDGTTGNPVNAGNAINTAADEQAPFYQTSSNTLVFSTNGRTGMGGYDLFAAKGDKPAENLGYPVNSSRDDIYFFAPEKSPLLSNAIFSSDRGEGCCLESYKITKQSKSKKFGGTLRDCNDKLILANAEVTLKDNSGKIWKTTTDQYGHYQFDFDGDIPQNLMISFSKEGFDEMSYAANVVKTDESDYLTDKLTNQELCIDKKPVPLVIKAEDVVTVYFDFDKSNLKADVVAKLDSIYNVMVEFPATTIQISGYTDGRGTEKYNKVLSDKRARACADYLIKKGIDSKCITFVSFGACCPVEMELINGRDNADGRSKNRRALINVKKD